MKRLVVACIITLFYTTGAIAEENYADLLAKDKVCPTKNIGNPKTLSGTYQGIEYSESGDSAYVVIQPDKEEAQYIMLHPGVGIGAVEDAESLFGNKTGQKVVVTVQMIEFNHQFGGGCGEWEIITSVKKSAQPPAVAAPTQSSLLAALFTPKMLGANISFIEKKFGPAMRTFDKTHEFDVEGCSVTIEGENVVESLALDVSQQCGFDLDAFLHYGQAIPTTGLTFGKFAAALGDPPISYLADCLAGCGNADDPSVIAHYEGPRALDFINIQVMTTLTTDASLEAANIWQSVMEKDKGEDWIIEGRFNCDNQYAPVAAKAFKDVPVKTVRIGYQLSRPKCE